MLLCSCGVRDVHPRASTENDLSRAKRDAGADAGTTLDAGGSLVDAGTSEMDAGTTPPDAGSTSPSTTDPWGIRKIYPTSGSKEWFVDMNDPPSDPRFRNLPAMTQL